MIISLAIQKGGTGKTTTAINLAAALTQMGKKVLLVDLDPQSNLTHALGFEEEPSPNMYDLFQRESSGEETHIRQAILEKGGLYLIPSSIALANTEVELVSIYGREQLLKRILEPVRQDFDYIFIDCPPAFGMLTVNALTASDSVIMPLNAEFLNYKGLQSFMHHFQKAKQMINPRLELKGILLTKFDPRKKMSGRVLEQLEAQYPGKVFGTKIRTNIALANAQEQGKSIFEFDRRSNGAKDYRALAVEFLNK